MMKPVKPRSRITLPPAPSGGSVAKRRGGPAAAPRAKRDPLATRAALIDAAAKTFKREGYFATDTNAIARRAGYAPGSFYNHFADKTAILLAVYEHYVELEWQGVREAALLNLPPAPAGGSVAQRRGGQSTDQPVKRIASILDFIEGLHTEWARFRTDLRTVSRIEPAVAKVLTESRAKQMELLSALTGLSRAKDGPRLLMALTLVERYADLLAEAKALGLSAAAVKRELAAALQRTLA